MSTDKNITSVLKESRQFPPPADFAKQANVPAAERDRLAAWAEKDPDGFWAEQAKSLEWFQPWTKVLDWSHEPHAKWFVNGQLNASDNCLDRHLATRANKAAMDGVILAIKAAVGSYVLPTGIYGTYTEDSNNPVIVIGHSASELAVRCYVDEILVNRLPDASKIHARMFIRGTNISIPLEYVRVQPYVSPKIQLSNQRTERVDVRVLPILFRFDKPKDVQVYPGQLVDVYIGEK